MEKVLTHGSLFTGIGGIDLGLEWAGFETAWQVEINKFCNKILQKRWPNVPRFTDVRKVGVDNLKPVDLISGGFPCQDVSIAGWNKERGLINRSGLWFEFARIIRELRPNWVLIENVSNLRNHGADVVLSDLEQADYSCSTTVVGINVLQATHKRQRVFILAHNNRHSGQRIGSDPAGWTLLPDVKGKVEEAAQNWLGFKHELGTGNAGACNLAGESEAEAYARSVRELHGIPHWTYRLRALGNACVPQIPAIIGAFVQSYEREARTDNSHSSEK